MWFSIPPRRSDTRLLWVVMFKSCLPVCCDNRRCLPCLSSCSAPSCFLSPSFYVHSSRSTLSLVFSSFPPHPHFLPLLYLSSSSSQLSCIHACSLSPAVTCPPHLPSRHPYTSFPDVPVLSVSPAVLVRYLLASLDVTPYIPSGGTCLSEDHVSVTNMCPSEISVRQRRHVCPGDHAHTHLYLASSTPVVPF